MRVVVVERRRLRQMAAVFTLGVIAGFLVAFIVAAGRIDGLTLELQQAVEERNSLLARVDALEESLAQKKKNPIKEIKVVCTLRNEHTRLAVERFVRDLLSGLLGRDYTQIDPELVYRAVEKRSVVVEKQELVLRVRTLLIWQVVTVVVNASEGKVN